MTVDQYIKKLSPVPKEQLSELRAFIRKTVPLAEECMSYGMPAYKYHGMVAYICAHTHHTGFYINPGILDEFREQLAKRYTLARATVQIPFGSAFPKRILARMLKLAVARNLEKAKQRKTRKTLSQ